VDRRSDLHWLAVDVADRDRTAPCQAGIADVIAWARGGRDVPMTGRTGETSYFDLKK
jgi:hypothetical protein